MARASRARVQAPGRSRPRRRARSSRSGSTTPAMPGVWSRRSSAQRRSGSSGTPLWRATSIRRSSDALRVGSPRASCARGAGASTARSRPPRRSAPRARSGRCARACRPAARTSSSRWPVWRERPLAAPSSAPSSWMPVSTSTMPSPALERPGVHVRHAGPRQRQPQPPDARQHAVGAAQLALALRVAHAHRAYRVANTGRVADVTERVPEGVDAGARAERRAADAVGHEHLAGRRAGLA